MTTPSPLSPILDRLSDRLIPQISKGTPALDCKVLVANTIRAEVVATFPEVPAELAIEDMDLDDLLAYAQECRNWRAQFGA